MTILTHCVIRLCINIYIHCRMTKKSWFANMVGMEKEEYRHTVTIRNKQLNQVKADIVHAFLSVSYLCCQLAATIPLKGQKEEAI